MSVSFLGRVGDDLSICLLFLHSSIHRGIHLSKYPSIHSSINTSIKTSIYSIINPFIHSFIHPFNIHPNIDPTIHPSILLSKHPSTLTSIQTSIPTIIRQFKHPYIYPSIHSYIHVCVSELNISHFIAKGIRGAELWVKWQLYIPQCHYFVTSDLPWSDVLFVCKVRVICMSSKTLLYAMFVLKA